MIQVRLAALVAALTLALVGCSDDNPEPAPAPTPSTSTTTSSSPTPEPTPTIPVEPTLPSEARADSPDAAVAFVEFFWKTVDFAQATGKLSGLVALATPDCRPCDAGVGFIRDAYAKGAVIRGGTTTLSKATTSPFSVRDREGIQVKLKITNTRQVVDYPGSRPDDVYKAATVNAQFLVERTDAGWAVMFWEAT